MGVVRALLGLGIGLAACEFAPPPLPGTAPDAPEDAAPPDAFQGPCTGFLQALSGTFAVEAVPELNSIENDRDPVLSPDELWIYLSSGRSGGLWRASRGSTNDPFGSFTTTPFAAGDGQRRRLRAVVLFHPPRGRGGARRLAGALAALTTDWTCANRLAEMSTIRRASSSSIPRR